VSTTALTTDGRFPVRRKRPNRPSVDNAFRSSWCPRFGVRFSRLLRDRAFEASSLGFELQDRKGSQSLELLKELVTLCT
jgi:hypothetical protein